jgi:hypothetical protein
VQQPGGRGCAPEGHLREARVHVRQQRLRRVLELAVLEPGGRAGVVLAGLRRRRVVPRPDRRVGDVGRQVCTCSSLHSTPSPTHTTHHAPPPRLLTPPFLPGPWQRGHRPERAQNAGALGAVPQWAPQPRVFARVRFGRETRPPAPAHPPRPGQMRNHAGTNPMPQSGYNQSL